MSYEKTIHFTGDTGKAFEVAKQILLPNGFSIVSNSESSLELRGSGSYWSTNQNPLMAISEISICKTGNELSVRAELGGLRRLIKCLCIFILGMAVFFLVLFGVLFAGQEQQERIVYMSLLPLAPWPLIIPLMARFMKSRICRSLDSLVNNLATTG